MTPEQKANAIKEHNRKILDSFETATDERGYLNAKVAIIIGGSLNGQIHLGVDSFLPVEVLLDLLDHCYHGLIESTDPDKSPYNLGVERKLPS
jgi:hypothetical protein